MVDLKVKTIEIKAINTKSYDLWTIELYINLINKPCSN